MTVPTKTSLPVDGEESADNLGGFASIACLDIEYGLTLVRGNKKKYRQVLTLFAEVHSPDLARISTMLSEMDLGSLKQLVHTIKGSAAMIGAKGVAEAAVLLHSAIVRRAAPTEIEKAGVELFEELGALVEGIRRGSAAA